MTVLAHPPEGKRPEDSQRRVCCGFCPIRRKDIGPDDWVAVEDARAVRKTLVDVGFGYRAERRQTGFPGGVQVVSRGASVECGFIDAFAQGTKIIERGVARLGFSGG